MQHVLTVALITAAATAGVVLLQSGAALAQSVSGERSFDGGVGPLFNLTGPANLHLDRRSTRLNSSHIP